MASYWLKVETLSTMPYRLRNALGQELLRHLKVAPPNPRIGSSPEGLACHCSDALTFNLQLSTFTRNHYPATLSLLKSAGTQIASGGGSSEAPCGPASE